MDVTFASVRQLRNLVESANDLVQEVNLDVQRGGIFMQAMDTSHVCLVSWELLATDVAVFDAYGCAEGGLALGVSVPNLVRALKCAGPDDRVVMTSRSSGDTLHLVFTGDDARTATFDFKLMTIDADRFNIPKHEDAVRFEMPSAIFSRTVKDLAGLGDTVTLTSQYDEESAQHTLTMSCEGDIGKASITFRSADGGDARKHQEKPMSFSLKHLVSISKACALAETTTLELVDEMPLCVEFRLSRNGGPVGDGSHARFFLAPKIEDDDPAGKEDD